MKKEVLAWLWLALGSAGHLAAAPPDLVAPPPASSDVKRLLDWVLSAEDNGRLPFMVVDKKGARLFVFSSQGQAIGSTPVLLGFAHGDDAVPGIGQRPLALVRPGERTTPAGRFKTAAGRNLHGEEIIWVDYEAAVSMHRVRATVATERRLERLATPSASDNRISFGCINVPVAFFDQQLAGVFLRGEGLVYVLPEQRSLDVFLQHLDATQAARRSWYSARPATRSWLVAWNHQPLATGAYLPSRPHPR
ncbi:MAG: L,D-transpeptidase [Paucibacter sp.]|nr:L,D-transpeptidase [Roseateles sp.]